MHKFYAYYTYYQDRYFLVTMDKFTKIQKEIHQTLEDFQSLKIVEKHLEETDLQLNTARSKMRSLDKLVDKELEELDKLESGGIKSAFYKVLGSKEQQLEKERQDYLEVSLQFNEHQKMVELLEYEKKLLDKKIVGLPKLAQRLEDLKALRANEILNSPNLKLSESFKSILSSLDDNRLINKEVKEAITTGTTALKSLAVVRASLQKAEEWGRWDMMNKRGYQTHMKHSAIDQAHRAITRAQYELNLFNKEYSDIQSDHINFNLKIDSFSKFTDYFFDNLISDWIVQQKIKNSMSNVEANMDKLQRVLSMLNHEQDVLEKEALLLESKKEQILIS